MKKLLIFVLCSILILGLVACAKAPKEQADTPTSATNNPTALDEKPEATEPEHPYTEHQELTASQTPFDRDNMLRFSIEEVGLHDVFIRDMSGHVQLDKDVNAQVYLLGDDRYGGGFDISDNYLAIIYDNTVFVEDVYKSTNLPSYFCNMELRDYDGDGDCEILLQECVGMSGGAGSYISRVFDYKNGKITEIFSSQIAHEERFDTGYSIKILEDKKFRINNSYTGYSEVFTLKNGNEEYYKWWYEEDGTPKDLTIMVDTFNTFTSIDIDNDGVWEIVGRQYVSLIGHSDGIGDAITVFKYNPETARFEIIRTNFEIYD